MGRHFSEAAVPEGKCGTCPVFALYPSIRLTTEQNHRKPFRHGSRKEPSWRALRTIRCVDLPTALRAASTDLLILVTLSLRFRRPGSTLGQRKYLLSCRTTGFPTPVNLSVWLAGPKLLFLWTVSLLAVGLVGSCPVLLRWLDKCWCFDVSCREATWWLLIQLYREDLSRFGVNNQSAIKQKHGVGKLPQPTALSGHTHNTTRWSSRVKRKLSLVLNASLHNKLLSHGIISHILSYPCLVQEQEVRAGK